MPSAGDLKSRGVGDYNDVRVGLRFYWQANSVSIESTPGVFYLDGRRRVFSLQGWYESLAGNTAWLTHYTLPVAAPGRVRVDSVRIRIGTAWKDLTPLYNSVVMLYAPHWTLRPDGLWQAPVNLVYPFSVYDVEGNGYYRVDELEDIGEHRYYIDAGTRSIVSPSPNLLIDGFRTSPTVEVFERVYPQPDGTIRSRWAPAAGSGNQYNWSFLMYPNGECLRPDSIEGNVWRFSHRLRPQSAVIRYYVMNTYCLFGNILEVFTEPCDEVRIWYDAADSELPVEFWPYNLNYFNQGDKLVCLTPSGIRCTSPPSVTGVQPERIEVSDLLDSPQFPGSGVLCVGCSVLDAHGKGVPSVALSVSTTTSGVTVVTPSVATDIYGRAAVLLDIRGANPYITLTFSAPAYSLSVTKQIGPVYSGYSAQALCHQVVYERVVQSDLSEDIIVAYIVSSDGLPVSQGTLEIGVQGDRSFRLVNTDRHTNHVELDLRELPAPGTVMMYVGKDPITLALKVTSYDSGLDMTELLLEGV